MVFPAEASVVGPRGAPLLTPATAKPPPPTVSESGRARKAHPHPWQDDPPRRSSPPPPVLGRAEDGHGDRPTDGGFLSVGGGAAPTSNSGVTPSPWPSSPETLWAPLPTHLGVSGSSRPDPPSPSGEPPQTDTQARLPKTLRVGTARTAQGSRLELGAPTHPDSNPGRGSLKVVVRVLWSTK